MPGGNSRSHTEIRLFHVGDASPPRQATVPQFQTGMLCATHRLVSQASSPYRTPAPRAPLEPKAYHIA